jgi:hypothetical protein
MDSRLKVVGWMEASLVSSSYVVADDGDNNVSCGLVAVAAAVPKESQSPLAVAASCRVFSFTCCNGDLYFGRPAVAALPTWSSPTERMANLFTGSSISDIIPADFAVLLQKVALQLADLVHD